LLTNLVHSFRREAAKSNFARLAVEDVQYAYASLMTDNEVGFEVAQPRAFVHDGRPFVDADPIGSGGLLRVVTRAKALLSTAETLQPTI
jgi:hypothetical protein